MLNMPRTARVVVPNDIHHITERGNYRQNIFQDDEDRLRYLSWIDGRILSVLPRGRPKKQRHKYIVSVENDTYNSTLINIKN